MSTHATATRIIPKLTTKDYNNEIYVTNVDPCFAEVPVAYLTQRWVIRYLTLPLAYRGYTFDMRLS